MAVGREGLEAYLQTKMFASPEPVALPVLRARIAMTAPDALLLIAPGCPHCAGVLDALGEMVKAGEIAELRVVNAATKPGLAAEYGVRSVPWVKLGPFELTGARSRGELAEWVARLSSPTAMTDYLHLLLKEGRLGDAQRLIERAPRHLADLLPIFADPEAAMNVRLGANVILESHAGGAALGALVARLAELAHHQDARVRADACYLLGMTGRAEARPALEAAARDADAEVREIAGEALAQLQGV